VKKIIAYLSVVSICLFLFCGIGGCKKEIPAEKATEVEKAEKAIGPVEVVSDGADEKIDLRVFYAGLPDTDRQKDFVGFLKEHFGEVGVGDYNTFTADQADGFDVVILDHDGFDTQAPTPHLGRDYSRATVTMGVPGGDIGSRMSLKTGYL
jgi:hypothetical protein